MHSKYVITFALGLVGCTSVENQGVSAPDKGLDETSFKCSVEPVLARSCSYTGCHGVAGHPFRVYSAGKLRATDPSSLDDLLMPLTDAEHHANYLSAAGFAFQGVAPDDNLLLRKNLPADKGGYSHLGGANFTGPDDAGYKAIRAWLAGGTGCP